MNIINLLQNNNVFVLILVGFISLCVGSFLNVVIYRIPIILSNSWREEALNLLNQNLTPSSKIFNLLFPRSHCPECKVPIPFWHNIPIISYFILRGKCEKCKTPISPRYPFVEFLTCICSVYIAYKFGLSIKTLALLFLTWGLIALTFIDIDNFILPDEITLPLLWLGLLVNSFGIFTTPVDAIYGAITGYVSLWLIAFIFFKIRKIEGMGHGDFKLLALFGAWFGWQAVPFVALVASLSGSVIGIYMILFKKQNLRKAIPFGPYLAVAGWMVIFLQDNVLNLYRQIFMI